MYKCFFKRFFDIIIALLFLPFILFVFVVIAPIIYFTDKGPVFYNAKRAGKRAKPFKMFKFRSMYVNSPDLRNADGSTYNGEDDPRVTRIGKILRKTSLDELPQLLNVLLGDMSLKKMIMLLLLMKNLINLKRRMRKLLRLLVL